jgi:hypothetical protein
MIKHTSTDRALDASSHFELPCETLSWRENTECTDDNAGTCLYLADLVHAELTRSLI